MHNRSVQILHDNTDDSHVNEHPDNHKRIVVEINVRKKKKQKNVPHLTIIEEGSSFGEDRIPMTTSCWPSASTPALN